MTSSPFSLLMTLTLYFFVSTIAAGKLLSTYKGQLPTRLWIAPPTRMDEKQLIAEGYYSTFGNVGARTETPGCSLCMGAYET
jgi:aconitase B